MGTWAAEGVGPYGGNGHSPVGAIHESPAFRLSSPRGNSKRGPAGPLLVVSNREVLRRGRKRNLPLLSIVFFGSFLLDKQKKGTSFSLSAGGDKQSWDRRASRASLCPAPTAQTALPGRLAPRTPAAVAGEPGENRIETTPRGGETLPAALFLQKNPEHDAAG